MSKIPDKLLILYKLQNSVFNELCRKYDDNCASLFDVTQAIWNHLPGLFAECVMLFFFSFLFYVLHLLRINFIYLHEDIKRLLSEQNVYKLINGSLYMLCCMEAIAVKCCKITRYFSNALCYSATNEHHVYSFNTFVISCFRNVIEK